MIITCKRIKLLLLQCIFLLYLSVPALTWAIFSVPQCDFQKMWKRIYSEWFVNWGIYIEYHDSDVDLHDYLVPEIEEFDQLIESFHKVEKNNFKGKVSFSSSAISRECNFKLSFKGLSISEDRWRGFC